MHFLVQPSHHILETLLGVRTFNKGVKGRVRLTAENTSLILSFK